MPWGSAGAALLLLAGFGVLGYPEISSWYSQYQQSTLITEVTGSQALEGSAELDAQLVAAARYNDLLVGGALVSPGSRLPTVAGDPGAHAQYESLLNANHDGVMGRLRVSSINVDLPIYHGTSDDTLARGVGHLEGTSLPVGGPSQRTVLTAHRGLPEATLFDHLDLVRVGDLITIEIFGDVLTYRVFETQTVLPEESQKVMPVPGKDLVTLVTCTPLGVNSHRILVTAERVTPTPPDIVAQAGARPDLPGFPWWAAIAGVLLISAVLYVWRSGRVSARRSCRSRTAASTSKRRGQSTQS
ncbi:MULTISPECIES: class C sortase [unclassified Microbacterium]|uniref:class C sortase n=1 Tax=unclassified Microbacterium TaxID=2609290 RepID=UPI00301AC89F